MNAPTRRWPVAILGATGAVGQTFVRLLANHPWFEVAELAASDRSAGKGYREAVHWLEGDLPPTVASRRVVRCDPHEIRSPLVFSALDSGVAGELEQAFARAGRIVLSNARNHRMAPDVPLVIPEVNAGHLELLHRQREQRGWSGGIVTNANCAATVAAMALAPLHERFGVTATMVFTMQATSGAGYPGVPSLDILGNVIPYIADEEPKLERELGKLLGSFVDGSVRSASFGASAHTNRVPTEHGHLVCLSVSLKQKASMEELIATFDAWRGCPQAHGLPSAPDRAVTYTSSPDRPQTRRDVWAGNGMTVTVGRVRPDPVLDVKLVALGHNTIRGAAGGSVLNAELMASLGMLPGA